jgi:hypothetical protein
VECPNDVGERLYASSFTSRRSPTLFPFHKSIYCDRGGERRYRYYHTWASDKPKCLCPSPVVDDNTIDVLTTVRCVHGRPLHPVIRTYQA